MILKIWSLVAVSFLIVLFSGFTGYCVDFVEPEFYDYVPYYPETTGTEKPNLFIGGINQESSNSYYNNELTDFAEQNDAIYIPTYYAADPSPAFDMLAVNDAAKSGTIDENGNVRSGATDANGLKRNELNNREYGTIIGYSGGTTSVVTAMANQNVKADTLILISPIMGGSKMPGETFDWKGEFEKKLQTILSRGTKIIIIQSTDDVLSLNDVLDASQAQYKIPESVSSMSNWRNKIEVHNVVLEKSGVDGHKAIFNDYASKNIKDGELVEPETKQGSYLKKESLASLGLNIPLLSPTSDDALGFFVRNKDAADKTSSTLYTDKARDDLWLIDMFFDPSFINEIEHFNPAFDWAVKPPVPMYLPSGEQNTYGYDFIYLPGIEDHFTDTYLNWVATYLNSIGGGDNGGYGGLLLDEDRSGEDGW